MKVSAESPIHAIVTVFNPGGKGTKSPDVSVRRIYPDPVEVADSV